MKTRKEWKKKLINNMTKVLDITQEILQKYIGMEFDLNFPDDTWKRLFGEIVQKEINRNLYSLYKIPWRKIETQGLASYTVWDMDIVLIADVLGKKPFSECCPSYVKKQLNNIRDERNRIVHLDYKDESDIFVIAQNTINYTQQFMLEVKTSLTLNESSKCKEENVNKAKKKWDEYYEEYMNELQVIKEKMIKAYKHLLISETK